MTVCDLHTHSKYSFDGSGTLAEYCAVARSKGINIIASTDHCDMIDHPSGVAEYLESEPERIREYDRVADKFPDIELLYGLELGNQIDMPERTAELLRDRTFDFILGSTHFLPDGSDIYELPYSNREEVDYMFTEYFNSELTLSRQGDFDSLAHLEYPIRYLQGKYEPTVIKYRDIIGEILKELIKREKALEMNTRGTRDWQGRVELEDWVLDMYREMGGRLITIGSDAHEPNAAGSGFAEAIETLKRTEFKEYYIYRKRQPVEISIL